MRNIVEFWKPHAVSAMLILCLVLPARADWTRVGNTITHANGWVLKVEARTINGVSGLRLPSDCVTTKGTPSDRLDLSGAISDESVIVELGDYSLRTSKAGTLKDVTLPDGVIRLGTDAFGGQTSLTNLTPLLPPSVKIVGNLGFGQNNNLAGDLDATSVTNMGTQAFRYSKITSVKLGSGLAVIPSYAFEVATALRSVTLPETGLVEIQGSAFYACSSLTNVVPFLPSSVKTIGGGAFGSLANLKIPCDLSSVTNLASAFDGAKITSLIVGPGIKRIPDNTFRSSLIGSVVLHDDIEYIGWQAFSDTPVTNIVPCLPSGLRILSIQNDASGRGDGQANTFSASTYTGRVEIVNSGFTTLPSIGFKSASAFELGIGVTRIGSQAFDSFGNRPFNLYFRGGFPFFNGTKSTYVFRGQGDWKLRVFYPSYDDGVGSWRDWIAANATPLTAAQTNTYVAAYPGAPLPAGRGNSGTIFANEYLVPWQPPALSTNALHVVGSVTRNVVGAGEPAQGEVVPAYGIVENVADGSTIACSAPATGVFGGLGYACAGYVLETLGAFGWENPVTNLASTSFVYTQSGSAAKRLVWLWDFSGWMLTCAYDTIKGTVVASPAPNGAGGSYLPGTEVTLVCTPKPGCTFDGWVGDTEGLEGLDSATLTFTVDKARKIYPKIKGFWQMANSGNTLISDGEWTFNCADYTTNPKRLKITGVSTRSPYGSVDFAQPIKDFGGNLLETARITKLGDGGYGYFFSGDTTLYAVELDSATTAFGHSIFQNCSNLRTVKPFLPPTVTSMMNNVFNGCVKLVGKLYLPCNPGQNDFANMASMIEIEIAEGVTTVNGDSAFQGCANVQKVVLPSTLTTLGNIRIGGSPTFEPAFPPSLKSIASDAFKYAYIANGDIRLVPHKANGPITGWSGECMLGGPPYSGNPNVTDVTLWTTALSPRLFQNWSALRTVRLVGDRPSFGPNLFAGVSAYRVRVFVPFGNASWDAALGNNFSGVANVTACADPSPAELATYRETYPGVRRPKKVITFNGSNKQYLLFDGDRATLLLLR